jgi:hypothetical protein
MALFPLVLFAAFKFENDDLRSASVLDDGAGHAQAVNRRGADPHAVIIACDENICELNRITGVFVRE